MLTRLLHACGLYLGEKNELMPSQADNPDGFWEHLGFVALNDELLNALGGAWDLPPKADETFTRRELDPLRLKARLLIESFRFGPCLGLEGSAQQLDLAVLAGPPAGFENADYRAQPVGSRLFDERERNGTSYAFGLRLWEIYNRRLIEAAGKHERLVTHYDLFFENAEKELQRIANFVGLPDVKILKVAKLVATKRRHTHFTIDQLIDARVSEEVIELYRALISETSGRKTSLVKSDRRVKSTENDIVPGSVSRLDAFIPNSLAQIEHLYGELLAQTEARHKSEIEKLTTHLAHTETQHKAQVGTSTTSRTRKRNTRRKLRNSLPTSRTRKRNTRPKLRNSLPTSRTRKRNTRPKLRNSLPTSRIRKRNTRPKLRNSLPIWLTPKRTT